MKKLTLLATIMSAIIATPSVSHADDVFFEALTGGKVSFSARARYEGVNQDGKLDADAYTLRTTLGYETGDLSGFKGMIEFEDVSELGDGNFNDTQNGKTTYATAADPDGTEVNQAYLQYTGFGTEFKLGRQELTYRSAPFHRFIGNVLWRQNHQSFDAFSLTNTSFKDTKLSYAYINKVQTITGSTVPMDSHLFNAQYSGIPFGTLEGYGYLLEYEATAAKASSSKTLGARFSGAQAVNDDLKVVYTAEFANQSDYKSGTMEDQNYYLAELGTKYKGWLVKLSYEMQQGDGTDTFTTPLGTNHAFQGWADMFLNTRVATNGNGLEDMYFTVVGNVLGAKVIGVYHDFETDQGGIDAGDELDLLVQKAFMKHYRVGVKYSDYSAGDTSLTKLVDTEKFWIYGQIKF